MQGAGSIARRRRRMLVLDDARCSKFLDWLGGPQVTGGAELAAAHSAELGPAPTKQDTNPALRARRK